MSHTPIVSRPKVRMSQRQQASSPNATAAEWPERERNPGARGSEQSSQQLACDLGHQLFYGGYFGGT
jgi:hypothetical protein